MMRRCIRMMRRCVQQPINHPDRIFPTITPQCKDHNMPSIVHIFAGGERKIVLHGTSAYEYGNFSRGATFSNKKSEQEQEEFGGVLLAEAPHDQGLCSIPSSPDPPNTTVSYSSVPSAYTTLPRFAQQPLLVPPAQEATARTTAALLETAAHNKRRRGFVGYEEQDELAAVTAGACDAGAGITMKDDSLHHFPKIDHYNHRAPNSSLTVAGERTIIDVQNYQRTDEQKREREYLSSDEEESSLDDDSLDFGADSIDGKRCDCSDDETYNSNSSTIDEKEEREEEDFLSPDEEDEFPIGEGTDSTDDNIIDA